MDPQLVKDCIRGFLADTFRGREIADDQDIFDSGFGNSLLAMQLVEFVEGAFDIAVEGDDLVIGNFRSIRDIATLVQSKKAAA